MSASKQRALKSAKQARGGSGAFLPFRKDVLESEALCNLSAYASKLLLDICSQWRLGKNGDVSISFEKVMRARGWRSKSTLHNALKELRASGLIVLTRQGGLHQCSLYALGWLAIDDCGGKLDAKATASPLDLWKTSPARLRVSQSKIDAGFADQNASTPDVPTRLKNAGLSTARVPDD